jgi:hypothetical protein
MVLVSQDERCHLEVLPQKLAACQLGKPLKAACPAVNGTSSNGYLVVRL